MKKLIFLLTLTTIIASCNENKTESTESNSVDTVVNEQLSVDTTNNMLTDTLTVK